MICGQPIAIFAQDFTVAGGSLGFMHARKITKIMDYALNMRIPLIGINDSGGARIQEGVNALAGYGEIFFRNTLSSGVIPQISVILGPCAGGAVYSPALTDFVFVVENISKMFITGPEVIKTVLGEEISMEELGGARVHSEMTGNAHFFAQSEDECFVQIRKLISMIPMNNTTKAEKIAPAAPLPQYDITSIVPSDPTVPYDVRDVIKALVDESEFLEVMELFAANIVVGFGRIAGETVGFIANQPLVMAGVLDCDSSDKAARFIRFCDCFNIPIVTLEDLPGYLPGVDQERINELRHQLKQSSSTLMAAPRIGQFLREDRLIALVRQRLSIPGGCCSFDLPTLHIWLHMPQAHRDEQVASWLASLDPLVQSLSLILQLIRNSALFRKQTSLNGFYQDNGEDADLLRLRLDLAHQLYPQISGHKSRFAIRFLALDSEYGIVPERFDFELACC